MRPLFSVVVIARNEQSTLPRLVKSLDEFLKRGGEFIVLDTGSTDKTADIARSLGCAVIEVGDKFRIKISDEQVDAINDKFVVDGEENVVNYGDSLFDYASARNYAVSFATNDWVWQPDCDEIFTKFNIEEIEKAISEEGVTGLSYDFVFSHDENNNPLIQFLHSKMYKRSVYEWRGIIHEVLQLKQ